MLGLHEKPGGAIDGFRCATGRKKRVATATYVRRLREAKAEYVRLLLTLKGSRLLLLQLKRSELLLGIGEVSLSCIASTVCP